jgi:hypothetical protein
LIWERARRDQHVDLYTTGIDVSQGHVQSVFIAMYSVKALKLTSISQVNIILQGCKPESRGIIA